VPNLPTVVAQVPHWLDLLQSERSTVVLLLLELWAIAPELQRSARLSHGWRINHAVLQWSTARTTSGGCEHDPLPLLFLCYLTSLHGALLINGGAGQVIV
jgi:hypothetical protein